MTSTTSPKKIASFDVDPQKGFTPICPNELPVEGGDTIAEELNKNAALAVFRVGSKDTHPHNALWNVTDDNPILSVIEGEHPNIDVHWNQHCVVGSEGFEFIDGLPHPQDYDYFVWKGAERDMHPYGACYHDLGNKMSTGAIEVLKANKITTVIVGGLATDFCVLNTVLQLREAGFEVVLNMAACKGISPEGTKEALEKMEKSGVSLAENADSISFE